MALHGLLAGIVLAAAAARAEPPTAPTMSGVAPAADLLEQVDFYLGRASESLANAGDFDLAKQSRTLKDGNTLAVLALALAVHDADFAGKDAMPSLLAAAKRLASAGDDYEQAAAALAQLKSARSGAAEPGASAKWEKTGSLAALMKQVPLVHAGLKRNVEGSRLARQAVQSSGQSAALAAIAQVAVLDEQYVRNPADAESWRAACLEMRDAAGAVNAAIHAADKQRVADGMQRLQQSCEACHATFRKP